MVTQKELAKAAGVSAGSVSNVISGSSRVSDRVRKKVLDAIQALNYQPNLIARSLKTNRTNTLGIVIPDITMSFFPLIVRGAEAAVRENGKFLIVLDSESQEAREFEMLSLLRSQRVDGILLVAASGNRWPEDRVAQIASGPPVVFVDRLSEGLDADSVCVDDRNAAELGVSHLLAMGHRKIAVLTGPQTLKNERERLQGYRQALRNGGIAMRDSLIWGGSFDRKEIARACHKGLLLKSSERPSALFTTNGTTAVGALTSIYASGLTTPGDIAFATIDEIAAEQFFQPRITSVVQPAFDIGHRAVEVLLNRIARGVSKGPQIKVRLPATLVVRESSRQRYTNPRK